MADSDPPSTPAPQQPKPDDPVDQVRMSFGDHLEELRTRIIRALIGMLIATVVSLIYSRDVLVILLRPLMVVLDAHGQRPSVMAMGVADPFINFLKMGLLCGLIVSMPWMLYQMWLFVAAGLYSREQRFVKLFGPVSMVLFAAGVAFMYFIVLPIVLNFFVKFNQSFGMPSLERGGLSALLLGKDEPEEETAPTPLEGDWPSLPLVQKDPTRPAPGSAWVNLTDRRLKVQTDDGLLTLPLEVAETTAPVRSEYGLQFYISFVLSLALAFGIAFELPIAVIFLSATHIVPARAMAKGRRYIIFAIFVASAMLTPPDVISQILLAIPMIALFEGGLLAARIAERRRAEEEAAYDEEIAAAESDAGQEEDQSEPRP
ncbi:MAG TPA: twin-arginine translocase subunit TatC [Phycisphaerae bacterium]|nr:twin-arginine translocase subunit TatC [Phycisphaerae bacterium]